MIFRVVRDIRFVWFVIKDIIQISGIMKSLKIPKG
jgi:hypothetical protein